MKKLNNSCKENKMLNHREVLEALLAGETLVDLYDDKITRRLDGDSIIDQNSISEDAIALIDWKVKPKTININGYKVPEPIRIRPRKDELCYIPYLSDSKVQEFNFADSITSSRWFNQGLLHKTREAAELHLDALLSFTKHE
jgi:hypothetical protein